MQILTVSLGIDMNLACTCAFTPALVKTLALKLAFFQFVSSLNGSVFDTEGLSVGKYPLHQPDAS